MPGVGADGLDVVAERDELIIHGRVERPASPPDYQEFELGDYHRAFTLTEDLDTNGISATLRDGCCESRSPSRRVCSPRRSPCVPSEPGEPVMSIMDKVGALLPWRGQRRSLPPTPDEGQALLDDVDRWLQRLRRRAPGISDARSVGRGTVRRRAGE